MVNKVMLKHRINHQRYDMLICRIVKVRNFHVCVCVVFLVFGLKKIHRTIRGANSLNMCFSLEKQHANKFFIRQSLT